MIAAFARSLAGARASASPMGFVDRLTIIAAILLAICEGACPPRKPHSVVIPQTDLPGGYIAQQPAIDSAMTRAFLRAEATSSAEKSSPSRPPLPIVSVPLTPSVVQAGRMQLSLRHAPVTILCLPCRILLSRPSQRSNGPVRRRCLSTSSRILYDGSARALADVTRAT